MQLASLACLGLCSWPCSALAEESSTASNGPANAATASQQGWGHLSGRIVVQGGPAPQPERLQITKDINFCGKHDIRDESLLLGPEGGLQNVFVYLYRSRRDPQEPAIHPSYTEQSDAPVVLDNEKCRFAPHVLTMRTAQPLIVKNSDEVGHNANIESRYNRGLNPNIPAGQQDTLELTAPEREPVRVSCGSHAWMSAWILVRDEPYMALSSKDGTFTIRNLPEGEWTFQFWHERTRELSNLSQDGQEVVDRRGNMNITIRAGETTDLGTLTVKLEELTE